MASFLDNTRDSASDAIARLRNQAGAIAGSFTGGILRDVTGIVAPGSGPRTIGQPGQATLEANAQEASANARAPSPKVDSSTPTVAERLTAFNTTGLLKFAPIAILGAVAIFALMRRR